MERTDHRKGRRAKAEEKAERRQGQGPGPERGPREQGHLEDRCNGGRPENSLPHGRGTAQYGKAGGRAHHRPVVRTGGPVQKAEGLSQDRAQRIPGLFQKEGEDKKGGPKIYTQTARLPETGPGPYRKVAGRHRGAKEGREGRGHVPRYAGPVPLPVPPAQA